MTEQQPQPDAIDLLTTEHQAIEQLFRELEAAASLDEQRDIGEQIIRELSIHAAVEEQLFYPMAREALSDDDLVDRHLDEHAELKGLLDALDGLGPRDAEFGSGLAAARRLVAKHVAEEEGMLFPRVRSVVSPQRLREFSNAMQEARVVAPTHPHPHAPSGPPGNLVLGPIVALADRVRDAARRAMR